MVSTLDLAITLIEWVALFIPALAIMLNTLSGIYQNSSLLDMIGLADLRESQILTVSTLPFGASFLALLFALIYLMIELPISFNSVSDTILVIATGCVFIAVLSTGLMLHDMYRAGKLGKIEVTNEFEELVEENPESAVQILNLVGRRKQISQEELEFFLVESGLYEEMENVTLREDTEGEGRQTQTDSD